MVDRDSAETERNFNVVPDNNSLIIIVKIVINRKKKSSGEMKITSNVVVIKKTEKCVVARDMIRSLGDKK